VNGADQWYYLAGSETRGPVPSGEIVRLIQVGSLAPTTQVAQAGWQTWSPASVALSNLLGARPEAAPAEAPTYAIKLQCIAGPDIGKAYMIGAAEVSLGRVSGIGETDPQVMGNHVVLSWQNNVLHFRAFPGAALRVAGSNVTQGTLSNGQQVGIGASTWQVGSAPVELTHMLSNLGARLYTLTSTDKLEGFSLTAMFSEVFKARKEGELDSYLIVGTAQTTPTIEEVETGWPKPWFFMRVLLFMLVVYIVFSKSLEFFTNPNDFPGVIIVGALAVPLATMVLFWELNTPRNVTFIQVLMLLALGGAASLAIDEVVFRLSHLSILGPLSPGITEETAKLLAVIAVARGAKHKYILNGIVFGAAVGAGFAVFETAGYAFYSGYLPRLMHGIFAHFADQNKYWADTVALFAKDPTDSDLAERLQNLAGFVSQSAYKGAFGILETRAYFAPFGHIAWTAITAGAFWRVKGANPFKVKMLTDPTFIRTFLIAVILHTLWDTEFVQGQGWLVSSLMMLGLGAIAWYVAFLMVQQGLKQIKQAQVAQIRTEYTQTRETLTTTGRFRAQNSVR
jgi:protease PrsW